MCPACTLAFDCPWYVERHRFCRHPPMKPEVPSSTTSAEGRALYRKQPPKAAGHLKCRHCSAMLRSEEERRTHLIQFHAHVCPSCGRIYPREYRGMSPFENHLRRGLVCQQCKTEFSCLVGLRNHRAKDHKFLYLV